jgi:hypothetical protein
MCRGLRPPPATRAKAKTEIARWNPECTLASDGFTMRVGCPNMHYDGVAKRDLSWA